MSDIESQTQDATPQAAEPTHESVETSVEENKAPQETHELKDSEHEMSLEQKMKEYGNKHKGQKLQEQAKEPNGKKEDVKSESSQDGQPPAYEADYKYKAFGKEKELDPLFRSLLKDKDSEKKVKEVFTRADAFDDMKQRYENSSLELQKKAQALGDLDRDVKRVMHFRNSGDLDNFFASVQLSKQDIFNWAKRQLDLENLSPEQQQAYQQGVQARAENVYNQQNYQALQTQMADQRAQMMQIQLDHTLTRPENQGVASAFDGRMGESAFRNLVIEEAANYFRSSGQVLSPDEAVGYVRQKFGKLLDIPQPQATATQAPTLFPAQSAAPQVQAPVQVQGKPVIPNVQGRGTSPVKQKPTSLAQLKEMGRKAQAEESSYYQG